MSLKRKKWRMAVFRERKDARDIQLELENIESNWKKRRKKPAENREYEEIEIEQSSRQTETKHSGAKFGRCNKNMLTFVYG